MRDLRSDYPLETTSLLLRFTLSGRICRFSSSSVTAIHVVDASLMCRLTALGDAICVAFLSRFAARKGKQSGERQDSAGAVGVLFARI
jgi:hypothetical protein